RDAAVDSLVRRDEQSRRRHPMGADLALREAFAKERKTLALIRVIADMVVGHDTMLNTESYSFVNTMPPMGVYSPTSATEYSPLKVNPSFSCVYD
uniref:RNase adapter RapZ n=1 Tax=Acetomicrobium sp. S15 = DSM 107314 TaxID=2529858 RepID=UPI00237CD524